MPDLLPIASKLDPLIRRLASDQPGEVLACVAAIKRQLAKVGLDFNDLAGTLTADRSEPGAHQVCNHREALAWIISTNVGQLSEREHEFVLGMSDWVRTRDPTPKQAKWKVIRPASGASSVASPRSMTDNKLCPTQSWARSERLMTSNIVGNTSTRETLLAIRRPAN